MFKMSTNSDSKSNTGRKPTQTTKVVTSGSYRKNMISKWDVKMAKHDDDIDYLTLRKMLKAKKAPIDMTNAFRGNMDDIRYKNHMKQKKEESKHCDSSNGNGGDESVCTVKPSSAFVNE